MLGVNAFPMAPAGGVFIATMGVAVTLGSFFASRRKLLLAVGAALATIALITLGPHVQTAPPRPLQLWFLFGSIALEAALVRVAIARFRTAGDRPLMLAILFAVGVHFIPMAAAFGPLCLLLAVACIGNALIGAKVLPRVPLSKVWALDGLLKVGLGGAMIACAWL